MQLVSVIIPAYNAAKFIGETIGSVVKQTYASIEIIVVNDGSTDQTVEVVEAIGNAKIRIISQPNKGASAAKQLGLEQANGEFVQYLDADDMLSKNKIKAQVELLSKLPNHLAICKTVHFFDGKPIKDDLSTHEWYAEGSNNPTDFLIKLYGGSYIGPAYGGMIQPNAFLSPMSILQKIGPWDNSISPCADEDGEYFCRAILASEGIVYSPDAVNYYRKFLNKQSLSAIKSYQSCENILRSSLLKTAHLLKATHDPRAKLAMSQQLWQDAFNFYPMYKDLSLSAEKKAKELYPQFKTRFFENKTKLILSEIFGWKWVKYIDSLRLKP